MGWTLISFSAYLKYDLRNKNPLFSHLNSTAKLLCRGLKITLFWGGRGQWGSKRSYLVPVDCGQYSGYMVSCLTIHIAAGSWVDALLVCCLGTSFGCLHLHWTLHLDTPRSDRQQFTTLPYEATSWSCFKILLIWITKYFKSMCTWRLL